MAPCKLHMQSAEKSKSAVCRAIVLRPGPRGVNLRLSPTQTADCVSLKIKICSLQSNSRYVLHMVCSIFVQLHGLFE